MSVYIKTQPLTIAGTVKPGDDYIAYDGPIPPNAKYLKWDAEAKEIVEDTDAIQAEIEQLSEVKCLDVLLACEALGCEDKLQAILDNGFEKYWIASGGVIDLNHPLTRQALAAGTIDIDAVKTKILEMRVADTV